MTLLNWQMTEREIAILSDTLILSYPEHEEAGHVAKTFAVPHRRLLVAGTGLAQVVHIWAGHVMLHSEAHDIHDLAAEGEEILPGLWSDFEDVGLTVTLYSFGWGTAEKRFAGYAHRSMSGFVAESLSYAQGIKPAPTGPVAIESFADLVAYCSVQKANDDRLPQAERVGIGGDLILHYFSVNEGGEPVLSAQVLKNL